MSNSPDKDSELSIREEAEQKIKEIKHKAKQDIDDVKY